MQGGGETLPANCAGIRRTPTAIKPDEYRIVRHGARYFIRFAIYLGGAGGQSTRNCMPILAGASACRRVFIRSRSCVPRALPHCQNRTVELLRTEPAKFNGRENYRHHLSER